MLWQYPNNLLSIIDGETYKIKHNVSIIIQSRTDIVVNSETNKVYLFCLDKDTQIRDANRLCVFNGNTNDITILYDKIYFDSAKLNIDQDTNTIYVTNKKSNVISVINGTTDKIEANIEFNFVPNDVAFNPKTNILYVTDSESNTLSVINKKSIITPLISKSHSSGINFLDSPSEIAVNPLTNLLYVTTFDINTFSSNATVWVIDGNTNEVIQNISVGCDPSIAVDSGINKIYITNYCNNTVSVIDGNTNEVIQNISVGTNPYSIAVYSGSTNTFNKSQKIYVTNSGYNTVSVIDGNTNEVENYTIGDHPTSIAVDSHSGRIYIANSYNISIIDERSGSIGTKAIDIEAGCTNLVVNENKGLLYKGSDNTILVIDQMTNKIISKIDVPLSTSVCSNGIAINPETDKLYVTDSESNTVSVIDGNTNEVISKISVGNAPTDIAVNPATNKIYVTNSGSKTVSVALLS